MPSAVSALVKCQYDGCHTFEPSTANHVYCNECKCKRKREVKLKRLAQPRPYDDEAWQLEENRKQANAERGHLKSMWILENKSFAMFDIESSNLDADFGQMLCASVKPIGGPPVTFSISGIEEDNQVVDAVRDELAKYDYVVTWYGTKFDIPFTTTRLISHGLKRLGYVRHIDLYYTARFRLKLHSNRLDSVASFMFGKTQKTRLSGPIWLDALRGRRYALDYLIDHCERDVAELEKIFNELAPLRNLSETPIRWYG